MFIVSGGKFDPVQFIKLLSDKIFTTNLYNNGLLTIKDSTITKNMAKMSGGRIDNHAKLYLYGSNITYNTGQCGGGIYNRNKVYSDALNKITRNSPNNIQGILFIPS